MVFQRRDRRPRVVLVLLALISITLISIDSRYRNSFISGFKGAARDVYSPVQDVTDTAMRPLHNAIVGVRDGSRIRQENARLRAEVAELRGTSLQAQDAIRDRDQLLYLNSLTVAADLPKVAAQVVAANPSNFQRAFVLNKGTKDGIAIGMPVVGGAGLLGRITDISDKRSSVLLITDPAAHVSVRNARSGAIGITNGKGEGRRLDVGLVTAGSDVKVEDVFVTSGLDGAAYPGQIPVAVTKSSEEKRGSASVEIVGEAVVDFEVTQYVNVLLWVPEKGPFSQGK